MADDPMQGVAASRESDSIRQPSGSVPEQPSEQGIQAEAATAGGVQHTAPAPRPDETSAASGSQASLDQVNTSAGTIKAEKSKSQTKKRLAIRRHANKIARTDDYTEWYSSCSRDPLAEPPNVRRSPGILYVHRHKHETEAKWDTQVWMYARREGAQGAVRKGIFLLQNRDAGTEGEWVAVRPGQKHPELPGYVLHLRETGEPSWVKASTARTYRARGQADS
ncbi:hypothetical protein K466DRAFT_217597 [Polyporus arcularius HHB13444]|uniref:Uncharacterized protein n=1 Tax=Polyporus arcularius HHB13444 TaxID=1314778 RepID=A0A5C3PSF0_9APHY|nr:hypothetical protein K466DRAFT_217597 [Polyporus arcularius HHB13444]